MSETQFVEEAPESGKPYARKFQLWVETYDRATLEQFIAAVRGLAEGAALEADRSFTEAERAKREADRAKLMADSTATHNQNCQTAVTTCTQLVQQAKTAEIGANSAAGTAGGHSQTAQQAASAVQADAGRAQADAKRAKDEADRAQRIVDGFDPGTGGGGGYGHSDVVTPELGARSEPYLITKADMGKTILAEDPAQAVWLGRDTGTATDMATGDFCEVVCKNRLFPFVVRAQHGVKVESDGGCSVVYPGSTTLLLRKLGPNHWHISATHTDPTERTGNVVLNYHVPLTIHSKSPNLTLLRGEWDRIDHSVRGAFWGDDGLINMQQSTPMTGGNFDQWIRGLSNSNNGETGGDADWADLAGENLVFVAEWVRSVTNVRYIYGALDYVTDDNKHKLYIGGVQQGPKRLVFEQYPADRYLLVRVLSRENLQMSRLGLQVWFWDKLAEKMIFRLFVANAGTDDHIFSPSTEGAPNLDDWEIFAQWSGERAYTRYDVMFGRNNDDGSYATLEESATGWTNAQPWEVRPLDPVSTIEPVYHTDPSGKAAIAWIGEDRFLQLRLISPRSVTYNGKQYIQDHTTTYPEVKEVHFVKSSSAFCEIYILDFMGMISRVLVQWDYEAGEVQLISQGFLGGGWDSIVGQCAIQLPNTRMPAWLLVAKRENKLNERYEAELIYSGYENYRGGTMTMKLVNDTNQRGGKVSWETDNLVFDRLVCWGGWLEYTFHNGYWGWWWAFQTSDGYWLMPRDQCTIPYEDDGGGPQ